MNFIRNEQNVLKGDEGVAMHCRRAHRLCANKEGEPNTHSFLAGKKMFCSSFCDSVFHHRCAGNGYTFNHLATESVLPSAHLCALALDLWQGALFSFSSCLVKTHN